MESGFIIIDSLDFALLPRGVFGSVIYAACWMYGWLFGLTDGFRVALPILRDNRLRYSYEKQKNNWGRRITGVGVKLKQIKQSGGNRFFAHVKKWVALSRWTCLYFMGTSSLPTYSMLLFYFCFGRKRTLGLSDVFFNALRGFGN